MKRFKKIIGVMLSVITVLPYFSSLSFAQNEDGKIIQYNMIVEADGRNTHWEDENGNTVDFTQSELPSVKTRARSNYYVPAKYDARDEGIITSVKEQGQYGTCWAFAAASCVETSLIKKGLADNTVDLSEDHLVWFAKNSLVTDEADTTHGDGETYPDMNSAFSAGGTWMDSISTYARGSGPVYDSDYPYATGNWDESHRYKSEFRVTDCSAIDNTTANTTKIKRAIMEHGSVKTSYYNHNWYYNVTDNGSAYYNPDTENKDTNHDVTVVGWDDNYSKDNFRDGYKPENNGAWLVKGSWGDNYHLKDGYFWMSYDEKEIASFSYYKADSKSIYDNIYQYDGIGSYSALSYMGRTTIYGANVFTAKSHETLSHVGFYSRGAMLYTIYIYKLNSANDSPVSGTLVSTVSGAESYYGYHTAKLTQSVEVNEGDVFSAVIKIDVSGDSNAALMTEGSMYNASFNKYESYISMDGKNWDYIAPDEGYFKTAGNVCLKVMSTDVKECSHEYTSAVTPPTCLDDGFTTYTCSLCQNEYISDIVPAKGHTPVTDKGFAPTCTEPGLTDGSHCSECGVVTEKQEVIPAQGHQPVTDSGHAPTCTEPGLTDGSHCSVCEKTLTEQEVIDALEHDAEFDEAVAPTCTETGLSSGVHCKRCKEVLLEQEIIPANGHSFGEWVVTVSPSCTDKGEEKRECTECGVSETRIINETGHTDSDNDGMCDECGTKIKEDVPDTEKNCGCLCHSKNKFASFFWKIKLFLIRLFGIQRVCDCGKAHY